MTCDEIEHHEIAEQYLSGRLSSPERETFEAHYFDCTRCQERLSVLEGVRAALAGHAGGALRQPAAHTDGMMRQSRRAWRVAGAGLAAAAVIALAVRIIQTPHALSPASSGVSPSRSADIVLPTPPMAPPPVDLRALARFQPPPYEALRLRASATQAQSEFRDAMNGYVAGDYDAAASGLRRAVALDRSLIAAHFYLAVCLLQGGQTVEGVTSLQRVVASGESPYLEDALFFLAKTRIRQGDIAAARSELTKVVALDGDRRDEAREILARLP